MPSSKFNQTPVPRRRPAICVAPLGSCAPPYDRRRPPSLSGYIHWVNADPEQPVYSFGLIHCPHRDAGGTYMGETELKTSRLGVIIADQYPTPSAIVAIWIFDQWRRPEWHTWPDVPMPLDKPFDTRLLTTIYIPGNDFRIAQFNE